MNDNVYDKEVKTVEKTSQPQRIKIGQIVVHHKFGRGVVIGYSSVSGTPSVYYWKEQCEASVPYEELGIIFWE